MPDMNSLYAGYREATRGLESQGAAERERVNTEYDRQRNDLQQQLGNTERDVQRALGNLRTAERREQRKRDLPNTKPRDIGTAAKLADVRQQGEDIQRSIRDTQARVESARGESVADLERQVRTEQSKLNAWYREARAIQREYQRKVKAAQRAAPSVKATPITTQTLAEKSQASEEISMSSFPELRTDYKQEKAVSQLASVMKGVNAQVAAQQAFAGSEARGGVATSSTASVLSNKALAKEMSLSLIPIYGTVRYARQAAEDGYSTKEKAFIVLSIVGDVAVMVPVIKGATTALRSGATLSSMLSKASLKKLVIGIVKDERGGVTMVEKVRPATKLKVALAERNPDLDQAIRLINEAAVRRNKEVDRILADTITEFAKKANTARLNATIKRVSKIREVRQVAQPTTARARKIAANKAAAHQRTLSSLRAYREAGQKAAEAKRAIPTPVVEKTIRTVAATQDYSALQAVTLTAASYVAHAAKIQGMTMPEIRQATQQSVKQSIQAVVESEREVLSASELQSRVQMQNKLQSATAKIVDMAVNEAQKVNVLRLSDIGLAQEIEQVIQPIPDAAIEPTTAQKVAVATSTLVTTPDVTKTTRVKSTTQKVPTPGEIVRSKGKTRPRIRLNLPDGESVSLTREQYAGIVALRQGLFYILVYPPYGKANIIYTRKPVRGILYAKGPGSPQRSAAVVGGKLPRSFEVAMGITTLKVSPGTTSKQPRLKFKARSVTPGLGEVRPSRGKKVRR